MYERFTDRARKVMRLASEEARDFNHEWIDAEHLLLGLAKEKSGVAGCILRHLGADHAALRIETEKEVKSTPGSVPKATEPEADQLKRIIENAWEESRKYPGDGRFKRIINDAWDEARKLPESDRLKQVLVCSMEEARTLGHNYIGTEHLLLGLLHDKEGVAARVLATLGLKLDHVRHEVLMLMGHTQA